VGQLNRRIIAERAAAAARADLRPVNDLRTTWSSVSAAGATSWRCIGRARRRPIGAGAGAGIARTLSYSGWSTLRGDCGTEAHASARAMRAGRKYDRGSMHGRVGSRKSGPVARLERESVWRHHPLRRSRPCSRKKRRSLTRTSNAFIADLVEFRPGAARVATFEHAGDVQESAVERRRPRRPAGEILEGGIAE
jgi:release factor H-coupled RctB family protein